MLLFYGPRNPLCFGHVGRICPEVREKDRQEQLDRQPVGTGPYQLSNTAPGNLFAYNVMMTSGAANVNAAGGGGFRLRRYRTSVEILTGECDVLAWPAASQLSILVTTRACV